jgi:hypothetical protein
MVYFSEENMKTVIVELESISPYSQSKHYEVEKLNKGKEMMRDYEARTWRERMHYDEHDNVFIPCMAFKNCLSEAAKFLNIRVEGEGKATWTKNFEAGVMVLDNVPLGVKKGDAQCEWNFVPSDGKRGSGKRVNKCFPLFSHWKGIVKFHIIDEKITAEIFEKVLNEAGQLIGIGRFRPRNNGFYGRFKVNSIEWLKES